MDHYTDYYYFMTMGHKYAILARTAAGAMNRAYYAAAADYSVRAMAAYDAIQAERS